MAAAYPCDRTWSPLSRNEFGRFSFHFCDSACVAELDRTCPVHNLYRADDHHHADRAAGRDTVVGGNLVALVSIRN